MQLNLAPIHCVRTKPAPNTADADCIAYCANTGFPYLCKSAKSQPKLPAREWICTHLANACGLPVADCAPVTIEGRDDILFGSRWEGGTVDPTVGYTIVANPHIFSKALSFDFATQNGDRHLNNYLYQDVEGEILLRLIDFSRALNFEGWPPPPLPMDSNTNTCRSFTTWSMNYPFLKNDAESIIKNWTQLPNTLMDSIFQTMPIEWMDQAERDTLADWWKSQDRIDRGIEVGKYLP
ncbi:hypothetical protein ACO0LF_17525 [Undibacterium sp. Di27W]|uniref:hypothetical protein n=1 Tax=Undibacterium sp. Di27W TaxID=3413036 RepID=UPI003BF4031C